MLVCRDVTELVSDYLERALPLRRRLAVRLHLLRCDACRRYIDQMRKTVRLLSRGQLAASSPELEDRLIAGAPEAPPSA
jgi:predicted anti-sigma-YlaC factor YlaD